MSSTPSVSDGARRHSLANYLGAGLLIALVLLLAWLQFRWLTQLSHEEEARRRVALRVAATNYAEYVAREMNLLMTRVAERTADVTLVADEPLLEAVIRLPVDGSPGIARDGSSGWSPLTRAEAQQRLGRTLAEALGHVASASVPRLWLDPPAVVHCTEDCVVALISMDALRQRVFGPARRMFEDFGLDLRLLVSAEDGETSDALYAPDVHPADFRVTDLEAGLLPDVPVYGPPDSRWLLRINHGGSSLEAVVARSHVRNVLISLGVMSLLALSIGLVVYNARRQAALAREQLYFVAGVSHELRTPLAVISSAAENLADSTVTDERRVQHYGELIRAEVRRLSGMIENVLQFAQSASAQRPRTRAPVQVDQLIESALAECRDQLRNHELRLDVPPDLPTVYGDRAALESALRNLIGNAARYSGGDAWISIEAGVVRVRPRGRALRISVINPVAGKPDPHPERLFEPFYRGQNVRRMAIAGTGIGLAVARNVALQHGGGLSVDADKADMISFNLYLPVHERDIDTTHTAG